MKEKKEKAETPTPGPAAPEVPAAGYETFDGDEALRYQQVGGRVVSVTVRHPNPDPKAPSFRPGKRYRFAETKTELDRLLAAEEGR